MSTAQSFRIQLAALVLGTASMFGCASGEQDDGSDRAGDELASIPHVASKRVCATPTGAHFAAKCAAMVKTDSTNRIKAFAATAASAGFGATDLESAYALDTTGGAGKTIAIADYYHYPQAESDLATYRSQYGLPACSTASGCLKILNPEGGALPTATDPQGWNVEAALDLQMASAACPNCKIILFEADPNSSASTDPLFTSQNAAATAGANVVSNSWSGPEDSGVASEEAFFNHTGVGYFAATGDDGYEELLSTTAAQHGPQYPSTSAFVTAVGGTKLVKSSTTRGWTEGAWSVDGTAADGATGSSCSTSIAKPSWQTQTVCAKRAASDVSAVADPSTAVAVFSSANGGWIGVGGTSAATPLVAGIYALTGHAGAGPSFPYANAADFFDVTTGSNGGETGAPNNSLTNAGAGWDGPTGLGTPNGKALAGGGACTPACSGKTCGDDGCGGTCGTCPSGDSCTAAGQCQAPGCTPACTGKTCGDDGCGGSCGSCTGGATCGASGTCSGGGSTCSHPICSTGTDLDASCDTCAAKVCASDDYCCTNAWDSICVGEVTSICGESCSGGGGGGGSTCTHSECSAGTKLKKGCDSCATEICSEDSYCCATKWDSVCVSEVSSICGESCD